MIELKELKKQLQEQQNKINYLQLEIERLEQIEQDGQWEPEYGDIYYFLTSGGTVDSDKWLDTGLDKDRLFIGNVYRTNAKAMFEEEKLNVIAELKKYSRKFVEGKDNYYIIYNSFENDIIYGNALISIYPILYFPSLKIAKQAVHTVGEDRVKKYYCEMESNIE